MKIFNFIFLLLLTSLFSVFAQEVPVVEAVKEVVLTSNADLLELLIKSIGGVKGASTLAIVGIVLKFLFALMNSKIKLFKEMKGSLKITIITGLTWISGVAGLMISTPEMSAMTAAIHSTSLAAFVVFANQLYKQFVTKKD